jgi:hypothetical protein
MQQCWCARHTSTGLPLLVACTAERFWCEGTQSRSGGVECEWSTVPGCICCAGDCAAAARRELGTFVVDISIEGWITRVVLVARSAVQIAARQQLWQCLPKLMNADSSIVGTRIQQVQACPRLSSVVLHMVQACPRLNSVAYKCMTAVTACNETFVKQRCCM